jgi:hypothetical protein
MVLQLTPTYVVKTEMVTYCAIEYPPRPRPTFHTHPSPSICGLSVHSPCGAGE